MLSDPTHAGSDDSPKLPAQRTANSSAGPHNEAALLYQQAALIIPDLAAATPEAATSTVAKPQNATLESEPPLSAALPAGNDAAETTTGVEVKRSLPAIISNPATDIIVDGGLTDWGGHQSFGEDPDDISGDNNPIDWLEAWAAHTVTDFYIAFRNDGPVDPSSGQMIFLDTGTGPQRSYRANLPIDADYVIQSDTLYRYNGNGSNWNWTLVARLAAATAGAATELSIPLAALNYPDRIHLAFVGSNAVYAQGAQQDYYPDGLHDTNADLRYFEYQSETPDAVTLRSPEASYERKFRR